MKNMYVKAFESFHDNQLWVVYIQDKDYEGSTTIVGIVSNLESFKKVAKEKYGIINEPIEN